MFCVESSVCFLYSWYHQQTYSDEVSTAARNTELNTTTIFPPQPLFSSFHLITSPPLIQSFSSSSCSLLKACVGVMLSSTMEPSPNVIFFLVIPPSHSHLPSCISSFPLLRFDSLILPFLLLVLLLLLVLTAHVGVISLNLLNLFS